MKNLLLINLMIMTCCFASRPKKPNVILLLTDDLGWQDVKYYGIDSPSPMDTPNIDKLAKKGIQFWQGYSPAPSCAPSRNTIHEQISTLSEHTLTLFHQAILKCVKESGLDDFSAVIIDSTAIKADSSWPVDSALLKNLSCKVMKNIQKVHDNALMP